ncbi:CRISPR-associated helicase Cas3' [Myxococcota bacterium]|nr:CRISPR-associated helicase Cas3' [Myxococcota bacterium]
MLESKGEREGLWSHPHQRLLEHVDQVYKTTGWIVEQHSSEGLLGREDIRRMALRLARLHDLGKGTPAFQSYIRDPARYQGKPNEKAHTPLSLVLTLWLAKQEGWGFEEAFALAQAAWGHHTRLRGWKEMVDLFVCDQWMRVIERQLPQMDLRLLGEESGEVGLMALGEAGESVDLDELGDWWGDEAEKLERMGLEEGFAYRVKVQALFSVLLEADKALLVMGEELYKEKKTYTLSIGRIDAYVGEQAKTPLDRAREEARQKVLLSVERAKERVQHLILPTGMGKTLAAASWAFGHREKALGRPPKVVVVMPFLSVIEQTERVYRRVLEVEAGGSMMLASHSLSERVYDSESGSEADFFLDTWRSEIIVTTYDQLLLVLFDPRARYQMRFHGLMDALLILDELQGLPCGVWEPVSRMLGALCAEGNTRVLAMSATLPPFLSGSVSVLEQGDVEAYRGMFQRYRIVLEHRRKQTLEEFKEGLLGEVEDWEKEGKRVLITLNTRRSARWLRDRLAEVWGEEGLYFLSADVTPLDRSSALRSIRKSQGAEGGRKGCLVVSTQCIEAGVDIDMDLVIRDFAPLDSLIQISGRCNRNGEKPRCDVRVVSLCDEGGKSFAEMIYDRIHLDATHEVLRHSEVILEEQAGGICDAYFGLLSERKNTGLEAAQKFARFEGEVCVRELLRGKQAEQYTIVIAEQIAGLRERFEEAMRQRDRWERRRALRGLAAEMARVSVQIYATKKLDPNEFAEERGVAYFLREDKRHLYTSARGLDLEGVKGGEATVCF